jgi:hypothetical protein
MFLRTVDQTIFSVTKKNKKEKREKNRRKISEWRYRQ